MRVFIFSFLLILVSSLTILGAPGLRAAESPPADLGLPAFPAGKAPQSDCHEVLIDWSFAAEHVVGKNKKNIFLIIDRYGGKREFADYRGTMCRIQDMEELWGVPELFAALKNIAFSDDGRYFVNGIGSVPCATEEEQAKLQEVAVLIFHRDGEPVKQYFIEELLPNWREECKDSGRLAWFGRSYSFEDAISSENPEVFYLKTSDGTTHYFKLANGEKISKPGPVPANKSESKE